MHRRVQPMAVASELVSVICTRERERHTHTKGSLEMTRKKYSFWIENTGEGVGASVGGGVGEAVVIGAGVGKGVGDGVGLLVGQSALSSSGIGHD